MELKDNCSVCRISMLRKPVIRLSPCSHLLHAQCAVGIAFAVPEDDDVLPIRRCPNCRTAIENEIPIERKVYKKYTNQDRERIVASANKGEDWVSLCNQLNVPYKSAYNWVRSGSDQYQTKGGKKKKILSRDQVGIIIEWVEDDCTLTLKQIKAKIQSTFNIQISISTIGNYLEGQMYSMKNVHKEPINLNNMENKTKRAEYVQALNNFIEQGKQIVWMDESNFNLFCRRSRGRSKVGMRAIQQLPVSKGPNVHLIGAISAAGVVAVERRRGSFTSALANEWVAQLINQWQEMGNLPSDLVIVLDNAPCHANLEQVIDPSPATLLRLPPYSPMLNPMETIWSKIKAYVKRHLRVPEVVHPGVMEQRLVYLENIVDEAKNTISGGDCARAAQHSTVHHPAALAMEDMSVGR